MVALGDVRGPTGGIRVRRGGGWEVAAELVQVAADGVPPVPVEVVEEARAMLLDVRPDGMRPMAKAFAEADLRDVLPRVQVPTLLLYGEADQRSPLEGVANDLHAKIPGPRLVVLGYRCRSGGRSVRRPSYSSAGPSAGGPADQVVALGDVRGAAGGLAYAVAAAGMSRRARAGARALRLSIRYLGIGISWCRGPRLSSPSSGERSRSELLDMQASCI